MVAPVQDWQARLTSLIGLRHPLAITTAYYLAALMVAPVLTFSVATALDPDRGAGGAKWWESATRFSFALVPLGFAMWLSHYSFHLLTSCQVVIPAAQRFVASLGWRAFGAPTWSRACCRPVGEWLPILEIVCLDLGLLLALYRGCRIASQSMPATWRAFAFWAVLILILRATGVWIVLQPMQMRGTLPRMGG